MKDLKFVTSKGLGPNVGTPQSKGRPMVNTPQFPGLQLNPNGTIEEIRDYIKKQKRIKGFTFNLTAGNNPDLNVEISGTARLLLGIVFFEFAGIGVPGQDELPREVTMKVNNEIIIENVHIKLLSTDHIDEEYYFIPRPLSGSDDVKMSFNNVATDMDVFMALYYI